MNVIPSHYNSLEYSANTQTFHLRSGICSVVVFEKSFMLNSYCIYRYIRKLCTVVELTRYKKKHKVQIIYAVLIREEV